MANFKCRRCSVEYPHTDEYFDREKRSLSGLRSVCKKCRNEREKLFRRRHWLNFVGEYGGKCQCCGEKEVRFLTIEHLNGGGSDERRRLGSNNQRSLLAHIKKQGYPEDKYALLCFNCNLGKARNGGVCPHVEILK